MKSRIGRIFLGIAALLALLVGVLLANTYRKHSRQLAVRPVQALSIDREAAAQRLAGAVRFQTISYDDGSRASDEEFRKLHAYLEQNFPHVYASLKRENIGDFGLLFTWQGYDASAKPIMLMAHQDVVPIAPGTEADWLAAPFAGTVRDGYVWGRGAWDDKGNLMGILEAVETLLARGYTPRQTIYLSFGQDEEVGGTKGARQIAALLKARGVRLEFVLDEGMLITEGVMKGIKAPLALVGIAEKGVMTVSLSATAVPGHSSMPPKNTAIGTLAGAIGKLEQHPMPASLGGATAEMLDTIAPEMTGTNRIVLSNRWLLDPLILKSLEGNPSTGAMLRTTTAPTIFNAGNKQNVLPGYARAYVNFRLLPGDTQDAVLEHVRRVVDDDAVVLGKVDEALTEASPVSSTDSRAYRLINQTIRETVPGTLVAPGLLVGATDSRYMTSIADQVLRFSPVRANAEDLHRFHGTNERMSVENYGELVAFYYRLLSSDVAAE